MSAPLPARRVYETLRARVLSGVYPPGDRLPPERELGEELGVSRLTVAKAMALLVAERRVERHRGRGTFVLPAGDQEGAGDVAGEASDAAAAVTQLTFISPGAEDGRISVSHGILQGLHRMLGEVPGGQVGVDFYRDLTQHLEVLGGLQRRSHAGYAIWPETDLRAREQLRRLLEAAVPFVLVDTYLPDLDCDYVATDNARGGELMVDHLAALGHRRMTYLTERADRCSLRDRLTGYLRGLVGQGIALGPRSVARCAGLEQSAVEAALAPLLEGPSRPTAIFASHDYLTMRAYRFVRQRGLRVPEDISIAGYDDIDAASHFSVPLTTIRQPYFMMGQVAAQILLQRIGAGSAATVRYQKLLEPELIVRQSTAPPPDC